MGLGCRGPMGPVPEPSLPLLKSENRGWRERGWREAMAGRRKSGSEDGHGSQAPTSTAQSDKVATTIWKGRYRNPIVLPIGCRTQSVLTLKVG